MADTHSPTLVSKSNEVNSATNTIFTSVSDGTDTLLVNADGSINVTVTGGAANFQYPEDSAHVSGDIGTEMLSVRRDTPVSGTSADGDYATLNTDANGRLYTNINDGGNSITVDGTVTVTATDLDIRDLTLAQDAVRVSANTTANSNTNPIFVSLSQTPITGEVHSYNTAAAVAAGASSNHDYTVVTAFLLKSVKFSNSGAVKVEIQTGPIAGLTTKAVAFIPLAGGTGEVTFDPPIEVPTTGTGTVRVIRTNRNFVAVDVYSTIVGIDA